jgi:hypothetical protein
MNNGQNGQAQGAEIAYAAGADVNQTTDGLRALAISKALSGLGIKDGRTSPEVIHEQRRLLRMNHAEISREIKSAKNGPGWPRVICNHKLCQFTIYLGLLHNANTQDEILAVLREITCHSGSRLLTVALLVAVSKLDELELQGLCDGDDGSPPWDTGESKIGNELDDLLVGEPGIRKDKGEINELLRRQRG